MPGPPVFKKLFDKRARKAREISERYWGDKRAVETFSRQYWAERALVELNEIGKHPLFETSRTYEDIKRQLEAGVLTKPTQNFIRKIKYILYLKEHNCPIMQRVKPLRPGAVKWKENADALAKMQATRPLKPPGRK